MRPINEDMIHGANNLWDFYVALQASGFSVDQAFQLTGLAFQMSQQQ